jgi:dolichyl-phosphate beta-glucosyltransferase
MTLRHHDTPLATLVVPIHNAAPFLAGTLDQLHAWLARRPEAWELMLVDDGSTDGSSCVLDGFIRSHRGEEITCTRFSSNRGKGFATRAGMARARGAYVLYTDCDLAYPPENLPIILETLRDGADAAIACRVLPQSAYVIRPPFFSYLYTRHLLGRLFNRVCRLLTIPRLLDTQAGLKGFRSEAVRRVLPRLSIDGFSFDVELLRALIDQRAVLREVPVVFRYDSEPSTVRFLADSFRMLRDLLKVRFRSWRGMYARGADPSCPAPALAIHADDFGLSPGVSLAIQFGLTTGCVTSTSLMLGTPHSGESLEWARSHPDLRFGVHLNVTHGRPVLDPDRVPSLVDRHGCFRPLPRFVLRLAAGRVRMRELRDEWDAQIDRIAAAGVRVAHLDSHHHVHLIPGVWSRVAGPLAEARGLPLRVMDGPVWGAGAWPGLKGALLAAASRIAARGRYGALAACHGFGTTLTREPTLPVLRSLLSRLKPGESYELVMHPGLVDRDLVDSGDAYTTGREVELELIVSEEFQAALQQAGLRAERPLAASRP